MGYSLQEQIDFVERARRHDRDRITLERLKEMMVENGRDDFEERLEGWLEKYGEEFEEKLEEWFNYYVDAGKCPACMETSAVSWAVVHGEAQCIECGYPATIYHYAHRMSEDVDRDDTRRISIPLWVHPEEINLEKMREEL